LDRQCNRDGGSAFDHAGVDVTIFVNNLDFITRKLIKSAPLSDEDRSETAAKVAFRLFCHGTSDAIIAEIFKRYPVGERYATDDMLWAHIRRMRAKYETREDEDYIARLNKRHAIVRASAKTLILDEQPGEPPTFVPVDDFHLWYANDRVEIADDDENVKKVPVSLARKGTR